MHIGMKKTSKNTIVAKWDNFIRNNNITKLQL